MERSCKLPFVIAYNFQCFSENILMLYSQKRIENICSIIRERSKNMCCYKDADIKEIKETIDGCEVVLKFSDSPNIKAENTIIDILMSAFEQRIHSNLGC